MIKNNKRTMLLTSLIILLPILAGIFFWDRLPERMVTHWGFNGEPDGWSSKAFAVLGLPLFLLAVHWLCIVFTEADPRRMSLNHKMMKIIFFFTIMHPLSTISYHYFTI